MVLVSLKHCMRRALMHHKPPSACLDHMVDPESQPGEWSTSDRSYEAASTPVALLAAAIPHQPNLYGSTVLLSEMVD
jgi:hypothetical protein